MDYNKEKILSLKICQFEQMITWPVSKIRHLKCLPTLNMECSRPFEAFFTIPELKEFWQPAGY